ncbi:hypothetical protein EDD11_004798 [Mortierella claussenii]|nr:hypothetical protein EDD11_004798 [Mortierella claussenii]
MIDLSTSWTISNPTFKKLADGPANFLAPSALSANSQSWAMIANGTTYIYSIKSGTWAAPLTLSQLNGTGNLAAATDPTSGMVYIPNGILVPPALSMLRINLVTKSFDSVAMLPSLNTSVGFSVVWSTVRRSMIFYGGHVDGLYEYSPTEGWADLSLLLTGDIPKPRSSACMVSATNGAKLVLFGGVNTQNSAINSDLYVLDVATMTWARGLDLAPGTGWAGPACAVSNDQLIVWGGAFKAVINATTATLIQNSTNVYNLKTGVWTNSYVAPASSKSPGTNRTTATTTTTTTTPSDASATDETNAAEGKSNHTVAILGSILGIVVFAVAVGALLFYRRFQLRDKVNQDGIDREVSDERLYPEPRSNPAFGFAFMDKKEAPLPSPPPSSLPPSSQDDREHKGDGVTKFVPPPDNAYYCPPPPPPSSSSSTATASKAAVNYWTPNMWNGAAGALDGRSDTPSKIYRVPAGIIDDREIPMTPTPSKTAARSPNTLQEQPSERSPSTMVVGRSQEEVRQSSNVNL